MWVPYRQNDLSKHLGQVRHQGIDCEGSSKTLEEIFYHEAK